MSLFGKFVFIRETNAFIYKTNMFICESDVLYHEGFALIAKLMR